MKDGGKDHRSNISNMNFSSVLKENFLMWRINTVHIPLFLIYNCEPQELKEQKILRNKWEKKCKYSINSLELYFPELHVHCILSDKV